MTCANRACGALLPVRLNGRRRRWCSERCRMAFRIRVAQKPKDDLDAFFAAQRRRLLGKLEGSARRIKQAREGSAIQTAWDEQPEWVLVQHRRGL